MTEATGRRRLLPAALACIVALEFAAGLLRHRDDAELERALASGNPEARVEALYILSSRNEPRVFRPAQVRELLASGEPLVREWTMTPNFRRVCRSTQVQRETLAALPDSAEKRRSLFFFQRERRKWMSLDEFRTFLEDRDR